jgi:hypothetical protein
MEERTCSIQTLEKCVGKCRSMAIAVPCAILYTRAQYATLAQNIDYMQNPRYARRKYIDICPDTELGRELEMWLKLSSNLVNGSCWFQTGRVKLALEAFTDASARRWGGIFRTPSGVFHMGRDFSEKEIGFHINVKEAVALEHSLTLFCEKSSEQVKGKVVVVKVDNKVLFHIHEKGGSSKQQIITEICKKLFWMQVQGEFRLQLQWVPSRENEADGITRESVDDDIRLHAKVFQEILSRWGGVFRDLMASSGNVQRNKEGESLPFYSKYEDISSLGTDVFTQNISRGREARWPDYCFPPFGMIGEFINFAEKSKAWCVVVIPETNATWLHLTEVARGAVICLAERGQQGKLLKFRNNAMRTFSSKYPTIAIELDYR